MINTPLLSNLQAQLHKGEAEAIAQAIQLQADLLLLDERNARRIASQMGLNVIGILGILVKAKQQGMIDRLKPLLNALISNAGFWMTENLCIEVLNSVDE